eukprot:TRINITY_DN28582_c0_g1_i1.p1 TRINITY_DN28582_c0_g1~~TRINITY_DN28582_c0_g1_i1.p1  ORF type:complete len:1912 (+),score=268.74 TRINITY_DN28582_c0_g1_i1:712-5736(+)
MPAPLSDFVETSCDFFEDFSMEIGTVAHGGWQFSPSSARWNYSTTMNISISSLRLRDIPGLRFVDAAVGCAGPRTWLRGLQVSPPLDDISGFEENLNGMRTATWTEWTPPFVGHYQLCFCPKAFRGICQGHDYTVHVGDITVSVIDVLARGLTGKLEQFSPFVMFMVGTHFTRRDLIQIEDFHGNRSCTVLDEAKPSLLNLSFASACAFTVETVILDRRDTVGYLGEAGVSAPQDIAVETTDLRGLPVVLWVGKNLSGDIVNLTGGEGNIAFFNSTDGVSEIYRSLFAGRGDACITVHYNCSDTDEITMRQVENTDLAFGGNCSTVLEVALPGLCCRRGDITATDDLFDVLPNSLAGEIIGNGRADVMIYAFEGLVLADARTYEVCWCGGISDNCDFVVAGQFDVRMTTTTTTPQPCHISPRDGEMLACNDTVPLKSGEVCNVTCAAGYLESQCVDSQASVQGSNDCSSTFEVSCFDGNLSYNGTCVAAVCGMYTENEAILSDCSYMGVSLPLENVIGVPRGALCSLECIDGYTAKSGSTTNLISCVNGEWSPYNDSYDEGLLQCRPFESCSSLPPPGYGQRLEVLITNESVITNVTWNGVTGYVPTYHTQAHPHGAQIRASCRLPRLPEPNGPTEEIVKCWDGILLRGELPEVGFVDPTRRTSTVSGWEVTCQDQACSWDLVPKYVLSQGLTDMDGQMISESIRNESTAFGSDSRLECSEVGKIVSPNPSIILSCVYVEPPTEGFFGSQTNDAEGNVAVEPHPISISSPSDASEAAEARLVPMWRDAPSDVWPRCDLLDCDLPWALFGTIFVNGTEVGRPNGSRIGARNLFTIDEINASDFSNVESLSCAGTKFGDSCVPVCNVSKEFVFDNPGSSTPMVCGEEFAFVGKPTCVLFTDAIIYRCKSVDVADLLEYSPSCEDGSLGHGASCNLNCPETHDLRGAARLICDKGTWEHEGGLVSSCVPKACNEVPAVLFGDTHEDCAGGLHLSTCEGKCQPGYSFSGTILCEFGNWKVSAACVVDFSDAGVNVEVMTTDVVQTSFIFSSPVVPQGDKTGTNLTVAWARKHEVVFADTFAKTYDFNTGQVMIDIVPDSWVALKTEKPTPTKTPPVSPRVLGQRGDQIMATNKSLDFDHDLKRRLQGQSVDSLENAFGVRLGVTVEEEDPVQRFNSGNQLITSLSESFSLVTFMDAFNDRLVEEGFEVPENLVTLKAEQIGSPVLFYDFEIPLAQWIASSWGKCDNECGEGRSIRNVSCPRGAATLACRDEKPADWIDCSNYDGCSFSILCPGGPPSPSCAVQAGLLFSGLFVGLFSVTVCVVVCLRAWGQKPLEGEYTIDDERHVRASWIVDTWTPSNVPEEDAVADKREHIIWDLDLENLETWFPTTPLEYEAPSDPEAPSTNLMRQALSDDVALDVLAMPPSPSSQLPGGAGTNIEASEHILPQDTDALVPGSRERWLQEGIPIMEDGEKVEYFSSSHSRWVPAVLHVVFADTEQRIVYHVSLNRGSQLRTDVKIDCIRPTFREGELVDIFSKRDGGVWTPGSIVETTAASSSLGYRVYRVYVEDEDDVLEGVPSERLRRRFVTGSAVEVYGGPDKGWSAAVVHSCINAVEATAIPEPLASGSPDSSNGCSLHVWTMVPVYEEDDNSVVELESTFVPSYLVRFKNSGENEGALIL